MKRTTMRRFGKLLAMVMVLAMVLPLVLPMSAFAWSDEEAWEDNVLCKNPLKKFGKKEKIVSVTFLDTTEDAPSRGVYYLGYGRPKNVLGWIEWDNGYAHVFIAAEGGVNAKYCFEMFRGYSELREINFNGAFHTDEATTMQSMFRSCKNLVELDVSCFDTSNVKNMSCMFYGCANLEELDLTNFDTGKVTNMSSMFGGCDQLVSVDVTSFDTSRVTTMENMFRWCNNLEEYDFSGWDVSNVRNYKKFMNEDMEINGRHWKYFFE